MGLGGTSIKCSTAASALGNDIDASGNETGTRRRANKTTDGRIYVLKSSSREHPRVNNRPALTG